MDSILSKLKLSLSLTLSSFLPFAGNLTWPDDSPEPAILYKPGDGVSLTVVETDADFRRLSANYVHNAAETFFLVPKLEPSDGFSAPVMSLQITLFPDTGFSIGVAANHAAVDGKTTATFLNSWASICKHNLLAPPPEGTPFYDRTAIRDPTGIHSLYLKYFPYVSSQVKKLGLIPRDPITPDVARSIFELSRDDIKNLRKKVKTNNNSQTRYISSFVLAFAYVSICMIKAQKQEHNEGKIALVILVDWRPRSRFPVPENYFGNGVSSLATFVEATEFNETETETRLKIIASKINDSITELKEMVNERSAAELLDESFTIWEKEGLISKTISVVGSPKFGFYDLDFGWGSGKKAEMTSVVTGTTVSLSDSRNGDGGIEVGIVLPNDEMNAFASLFSKGVK